MFPFSLSDDVNRYVWEGRIQTEGYNPYTLAPDSDELVHLRDANWEGVNHKYLPSVYPPAAQFLFRLCYTIWPDGRCLRLILTLLDLGTLLVLFGLAKRYKMEQRHLLLYALNPLVLLYIAGEGHLDAAPVFFLMTAILARKSGREGTAFFLLGMGTMFKWIPLVLFPFFIRRENLKKVYLFFVPFLLAVPFLLDSSDLHKATVVFAKTFYYNAFLFSLFSSVLSNVDASMCCWICFALALVWIWFLVPDLFKGCYLALGAFLLCSPILHQWYFICIVPFLPFFRSPSWLLLMVTVAATFETRIHRIETGVWVDFPWARCIEFVPFFLIWIYMLMRGQGPGPRIFPQPDSVSVIIPTLNEAPSIRDCIDSLEKQTLTPGEVLVVDGGSTDGTEESVKRREGVRFLRSDPGRGVQIAAGINEAKGDVVLILHGDSRLKPEALQRMMDRLHKVPSAVGGSFGHVFRKGSLRHAAIAVLDNLRARLAGISFGNQAQFFRKEYLKGGVPDFKLMEDVELSFRMKSSGSLLFISKGVENSLRRWKGTGFLGNVGIIVRLVFIFLVKRRLGLIRDDCEGFYKKYYPEQGSKP
jgi:hypothetical protein